jgi:hypothetical protein
MKPRQCLLLAQSESHSAQMMSTFGGKADIAQTSENVRFRPEMDISDN